MAVDQGRFAAAHLGLDHPAEVVRDHPAVMHPGVEEEPLADGMDRQLQDAGEPVPLPGEEGEIVVADWKSDEYS